MDAVCRSLATCRILEGIDPLIFADDIDRLLGHMYSSPHFLSDFKLLPPAVNVYLPRVTTGRAAPLMFTLDADTVQVVSEQMSLSDAEVQAFIDSMFQAYPQIRRIVFPVLASPLAMQEARSQVKVTQDMVLQLPASIEQYDRALGRATRSALKRAMSKLELEAAGMRLEVLQPGMDDARALAMLDRVLELNHARMALRGQTSKVDETEARAVRLAFLRCGMLVLLHSGEELVAGTINYRYGDNSFLYLLAHDARYNRCSPGMLCCYLTVLECIRQGQNEYHFLWGQYEYKYRLLATPREMLRLSVYRSTRDCRRATLFGVASATVNLRYEWRKRLALCALGRGGDSALNRLLGTTLSNLKKARRLAAAITGLRKHLRPATHPSAGGVSIDQG